MIDAIQTTIMEHSLIAVFLAQLFAVSALVMNSKLLRDDRWMLAMGNSWMISVTQFALVWIIANTDDPFSTFVVAATGGSIGCGMAHHIYTRWIMKESRERKIT